MGGCAYLIQWREASDDEELVAVLRIPESVTIAPRAWAEQVLRDNGGGEDFDIARNENKPAHEIIRLIKMPESFDPDEIKWL